MSWTEHLGRRDTWARLLFMLLFAAIYGVAEIVLVAVVAVQFGFVALSGKRNENLLRFGGRLARYLYDVVLYLTYNRDRRPFPFDDWPPATSGDLR